MFHTACYANCDAVSHNHENASNISMMGDRCQSGPIARSIMRGHGVASGSSARPRRGPGEKSAADPVAGVRPSLFPLQPSWPDFLVFRKVSLEFLGGQSFRGDRLRP